MEWLAHASDPAPELIWGLLSRGLGAVFLISFASLAGQVLPIAGRAGITPIADALAAIERDFPSWKRFVYFPSLLWLGRSDAFLRALPWLGMAGALAIIVGGPHAPWAFALCYLVYLSLERPVGLVYPWDCVLFEAGFFGMLLPATLVLPELSAVHAPLPAVAWVYRLLVFRVVFGFGKHKFLGSTSKDSGFLKSYLVQQPLPTPLGWHAQKLPMSVLKLLLVFAFVGEIIVPFAVFVPGPWAELGALLTIALMIGIQLTGNFGYFNVVMIVLALSWFDSRTAAQLSLPQVLSPDGPVLVHGLVLLHLGLALLALPWNTFCAHTWTLWSPWTRVRPRFLTWPVVFARALQPLRIAHAYGVFPPQTPPAVRFAPTIEVSWDGARWHTLTHRYSPTLETSPPSYCAPHHERFDQAVVYESIGLNEAGVYRSVTGRWDPYGYGGVPGALQLLHRIVAGTVPGRRFYDRSLELAHGPPQFARARTYMLEPTTRAEHKRTEHYWRRTLVGPHFPQVARGDAPMQQALPTPELWHFDDLIWLRRSQLGALMRRARVGEDLHALVVMHAHDLDAEHVDRFWSEFLPAVTPGCRADWSPVRALVQEIRARFTRADLQCFERIAARYSALLFAKLEPLFLDQGIAPVFGRRAATLDVKTHYHLRLLGYHILGEGKAAYDAVARDPRLAVQHAACMTLSSGNYFQALFRYEALVYQSQKLRLLERYTEHAGRPLSAAQQRTQARSSALLARLWGAIDMVAFLKTQFTGPDDVLDVRERWPSFAIDEHDAVVRVDAPQDPALDSLPAHARRAAEI